MTRKTANDLDDDPASIGGAMSKWPRRTVAWACRDSRMNAVSEPAINALLDREAEDLEDLADKAEENGINGDEIRNTAMEYRVSDAEDVIAAADRMYQHEYGNDGTEAYGDHECPYEEDGMDKACWRCPVPGMVTDSLVPNREVKR